MIEGPLTGSANPSHFMKDVMSCSMDSVPRKWDWYELKFEPLLKERRTSFSDKSVEEDFSGRRGDTSHSRRCDSGGMALFVMVSGELSIVA